MAELGLVARVTLDPPAWGDTVLARTARDSAFLAPASRLVRGVGATWAHSKQATLPDRGADWRTWLAWVNGGRAGDDPGEQARAELRFAPSGRREPWPSRLAVVFGRTHETAIRFFQARTGRDVIGELRRQARAAPSDTARFVFGSMLLAMDGYVPDAAVVAERFRSGTSVDRMLARREVARLVDGQSPLAYSATAVELMDRLLRIRLEAERLWRVIDSAMIPMHWAFGNRERSTTPILLVADDMPDALQARWRDKARIVRGSGKPPADGVQRLLVRPYPVRRVGPFALLELYYGIDINAGGRDVRRDGGMISVTLLQTASGWVLVALRGWYT